MFGANKAGEAGNDIHLLDVETYTWVNHITGTNPGKNSGNKDDDNSSNDDDDTSLSAGVIAGIVVGSVVGVSTYYINKRK